MIDLTNLIIEKDPLLNFKHDLEKGLSASLKQIPSKYFYDHHGSELFNKITRHPDYYLTRCELEILATYKSKIANVMLTKQPFNIIELGPGEAIKTQLLLQEFLRTTNDFTYMPIDISKAYLEYLHVSLQKNYSELYINSIHGDYLSGINWIYKNDNRRNMVLFLGSSIGNYSLDIAEKLLSDMAKSLNPGDYLLLGMDLCKDVTTLIKAYDDEDGITAKFNLNLLNRINRELNADFDLTQFKHYATYNVHIGAMESYLISQNKQKVKISGLNRCFQFNKIEPVHVEYSYKYHPEQINELAHRCGFDVVENFYDKKRYFSDSLWQVR